MMEKAMKILDRLIISDDGKCELFKKCWDKEFRKAITTDCTKKFLRILKGIPIINKKSGMTTNILIKAPYASYKDKLALNLVFHIKKLAEEEINYRFFFNFNDFYETFHQYYCDEIQLEKYLICCSVKSPDRTVEDFTNFFKVQRSMQKMSNIIFTTKDKYLYTQSLFTIVIHHLGLDLEKNVFSFLASLSRGYTPLGLVRLKNIIPIDIMKQFEFDKNNFMSDLWTSAGEVLKREIKRGRQK